MKPKDNDRPRPPFPPQHQEAPGLEKRMDPKPQFKGEDYKAAGKLAGMAALITGGDSGIGRSVAVLFAREGADVAITYLQEEAEDARDVQDVVADTGRTCLLLPGDVSDPAIAQEAVEQAVSKLGRLDILVNNIASMLSDDRIENVTPESLEKSYRTNVFSYYYMSQAALSHMKEGSAIINTGSIVGSRGGLEMIQYAPAQGAIHALTKSLAKELLPRGIRVNCVAPGPVWTPLQTIYRSAEDIVDFGSHNPAGRPGQPDEMAPSYVFLASNADSSYMTGEIIFITGGDVAR